MRGRRVKSKVIVPDNMMWTRETSKREKLKKQMQRSIVLPEIQVSAGIGRNSSECTEIHWN